MVLSSDHVGWPGATFVAQFADVSAAIGDTTRPMAEILPEVDLSFRPLPDLAPHRVVCCAAASGGRVDFPAPNRGQDSELRVRLAAFGTDPSQRARNGASFRATAWRFFPGGQPTMRMSEP